MTDTLTKKGPRFSGRLSALLGALESLNTDSPILISQRNLIHTEAKLISSESPTASDDIASLETRARALSKELANRAKMDAQMKALVAKQIQKRSKLRIDSSIGAWDAVTAELQSALENDLSSEQFKQVREESKLKFKAILDADNIYPKLIEQLFWNGYREGIRDIPFARDEIVKTAKQLGISRPPANLGDLLYTYRYRANFPESIQNVAPKNESWVIRPSGHGLYAFTSTPLASVLPRNGLESIKIPDSTPGLIEKHRLSDEQALLAQLRYNRLIDIFTGVVCYSLQNHLRTHVNGLGQIETDEVYVGVDKYGAHYLFPIQVKRGNDTLNIVQIWQDIQMSSQKFPALICRPLAAQFMDDHRIALFEFKASCQFLEMALVREAHYCLVPSKDCLPEDVEMYKQRSHQASVNL